MYQEQGIDALNDALQDVFNPIDEFNDSSNWPQGISCR